MWFFTPTPYKDYCLTIIYVVMDTIIYVVMDTIMVLTVQIGVVYFVDSKLMTN
jgi:hypothetical protein